MIRYLPFLLILAVWIYAFIDCLNTPEKEVRKLPKVVWIIIILLFGQVLLGPVAWFVVGRPRRNAPYGATSPQERRWVAPDDNPDFLKSLRKDDPGDPGEPGSGQGPAPEPESDPGPGPKPKPGSERPGTPESAEDASQDKRQGPEDPPR